MSVRPCLDQAADVFRPVVATDCIRPTTPFDDLLQRPDDACRGQREVNLHAERFAVEIVDDVEQPEVSPVPQLVMHEIHRPDLIGRCGNYQRFRLLPLQTLLGFDPQVQLQLPVNPIDPLVIPAVALNVAQVQIA